MRRPLILAALLGISVASMAAELNTARRHPFADEGVQRIIVKYRAAHDSKSRAATSSESRERALASRLGIRLQRTRSIGPDMLALDIGQLSSGENVAALLLRLRRDPDVQFAQLDQRRYAHAVPNDPLYDGQWFLKNVEASAVDAQTAWDTTTGSKGVVVAVLDTGLRYDHPDLKKAADAGRLLPGYDFVSPEGSGTFRTANDGDGRDSDPSDPGDWISTADTETPLFSECDVSDSSWHGTRVSGIIGALSNNGVGVAGVAWKSWILPVRVLGKCGGYDSDVIAGMRWAAGMNVQGIADNPYPAKVVNMSLGGSTVCTGAYQSAVSELAEAGVLVVVSAGNEGGPVDSPANCAGAVGVAGLRHAGTKVGFSSLGTEIALGAPGGNCGSTAGNCIFSLDTTTNSGKTTPGANAYTDAVNYNIGTSFSAPIVSGIAAVMASVNGNLNARQLRARLRSSAIAFPNNPLIADCHVPADASDIQDVECNCTTSTCGAGMANARTAVAAALRPIAAVQLPVSVSAGQDVVLNAAGSAAACDHIIASYAWSIVDPGMNPPIISGADTASATVTAPPTDAFIVRVAVTDDAGNEDTADITVAPTSATSTAPETAGARACPTDIVIAATPTEPTEPTTPTTPTPTKSGGGGGAVDPGWILALAAATALAVRRRGARRNLAAAPHR